MKLVIFLILLLSATSISPQSLPNDIVFSGNDRIYVVRADGSGQTAITSPAAYTDHPRWSRDGRQIVFTKRNSAGDGYAIWKMNARGESQTFIFNVYGSGIDAPGQPAFSPRADRIAFVTCDCWDPVDIIGIANADGSNGVEVDRAYISTYGLDWAPTGDKLLYSESTYGHNTRSYWIASINIDGTDKHVLTTPAQANNYDSVWSPDGSKIAFVSDRDGNSEIYTMNSDGSNQLRVTNSTAGDFQPTWSPDGTKLAFISNRNGPFNIYVINVDGTNTVQITHNAFDSLSPHWNPAADIRRDHFDFDGDGRTDVSVYRPLDGGWYVLNSSINSPPYSITNWGISTDIETPVDFDGDGKTDVAVYRPSTGQWFVINSRDSSFTVSNWGISTDKPIPADYDGDGKADISVYRPSNGTWYIFRSNGTGWDIVQWGDSVDIPVPGRYDSDNKTDIAVYRPSDGNWYVLQSTGGGWYAGWGIAGDKPVPADYDGDGKDDMAVYRPSVSNWYVLNTTGGYQIVNWGVSSDTPVPGDYDGDGKADVAQYRASTGQWFIIRSTSGYDIVNWGMDTDKPVPAAVSW